MLNINALTDKIKPAFENYLYEGLKQAFTEVLPDPSDEGNELADKFASAVRDVAAVQMAECIAGAIDYYVRSISIYGNLITTGSPGTHTATIASPAPATNGSTPNSLGIQ